MQKPLRHAVLPVILVLASFASVPPISIALGDPFLIRVFTRVLLLGVAALGLNLVVGYGAMVSLMQAGLFGLGGYVVAILSYHDVNAEPLMGLVPGTSSFAISLPIAMLAVAIVAALAGLISLRTSGAFFLMITLAFNQMLYYFCIALQKYGGDDGLQILGSIQIFGITPSNRVGFYYLCLGVVAIVLLLLRQIVDSRFGMVIRGAAQNESRMRALGFHVLYYRLFAFVLSGTIGGLAGALWAVSQSFVSPADMSWARTGELVAMVVLGGMASVWGPLVGAAVFLLLEMNLSEWTTYWQFPFGVVIILMVVFLPGGLAGIWNERVRFSEQAG